MHVVFVLWKAYIVWTGIERMTDIARDECNITGTLRLLPF